jgi:hypothetical protein
MSSNKKFIPLSECYNKVLKGKKPEPLQESKEVSVKQPATLQQAYRVILQRLNETTDILMQQEPTGEVEEYSVSDDLANRIKKDIKKETKIKTEEGEEVSIKEIIDRILAEKGWKDGNKDYDNVLYRVLQAFSTNDIIAQKIANYVKLSKVTQSPFREKLLNAPGTVVAYKDLIPSWFNDFFEDKNGLTVANALWPIQFKLNVNVGSGELAFTLISDAKKGNTGDLNFEGIGDVEVKGLGARMGGDGFAHVSTANELNNIISAGGSSTSLFDKTSERLKKSIVSVIDAKIAERTKIKNTQQEIALYNKAKQDILAARSFDEIKTDLQNSPLSQKSVRDIINNINNNIDRYTKHIKKEVKGEFFPAILTFFTSFKELSDQQLVDGIVATRNYKAQSLVPALKSVVSQIVAVEKNALFSDQDITPTLKLLIAAIHIAVYQQHMEFKDILFLNDKTRNVVLYKFTSDNIQENVKNVYEFLKRNNVYINPSIEEKFKSVGVEFRI